MDNNFKELFQAKLNLSSLPESQQQAFDIAITKYLTHGRKGFVNGRTLEFVDRQLTKLIFLLLCIGYNQQEIVQIITNLPSILNTVDDIYKKYLLLGVIENNANTIRKDRLLHKTKDFMVGFKKIYARYKLICESGYNNFNWNILVHASDNEFSKIFVQGAYRKEYQLFITPNQVLAWLDNVDSDEFDLEIAKSWSVNKEIVEAYEQKQKSKY